MNDVVALCCVVVCGNFVADSWHKHIARQVSKRLNGLITIVLLYTDLISMPLYLLQYTEAYYEKLNIEYLPQEAEPVANDIYLLTSAPLIHLRLMAFYKCIYLI